ncbi:MAG: signal peptidase II [bacterium]|nr:signal peptidase II [bacterium]
MSIKKRILLVSAIVLVLVAADHATKYVAVKTLKGSPSIKFPESWGERYFFSFKYATNTGAFLSLGSQLPEKVRPLILTGLNMVILGGMAAFLFLKRGLPPSIVVALALILSGGLGNILDRLFREGHVVVDFMYLQMPIKAPPGAWWDVLTHTGIFNIADLAIVGGLLFLVAMELFRRPPENLN